MTAVAERGKANAAVEALIADVLGVPEGHVRIATGRASAHKMVEIAGLGFQLDFQGPADDVYYGHVSRDGIGIMLKTITPDVLPCPNHTRHAWARWDAYIYTLHMLAFFRARAEADHVR